MNIKFFLLTAAVSITFAKAQDSNQKWSFESCVEHAITHNLVIKQKQIQNTNAAVALNTAKMSRLPDLNAGLGQNWSFGRTNYNQSGIYENQTTSRTGFDISSSTPLFTGFRISNQIEKSRIDLEASLQNLEKAKEDLVLNVTSLFLQVLFNQELLKISEEQLSLTQTQVDRTIQLLETGKVPKSQVYDIQAQAAKDEVSLIQAENNLQLSLLDLAQSLELERIKEFNIISPNSDNLIEESLSSILLPEIIYANALGIKPQIREQELRLESANKDVNIAKSGYLPKLNFNLQYNTSYFHNYNSESTPFKNQLKNNAGEMIGLSLSVPIFNRFQVRNQVKSTRLNVQLQSYILEDSKKTLYKEIQTAYLNAKASSHKYNSAQKAVEATQTSFFYAKERYETGKSTVFEFDDAKTKLMQTLSEQVQAKYDYVFRVKILDFYNGVDIRL
ncbi:transporter [Bacteroidales bacterium]|nr:transporter [Bacteroidales bacterium]